jgi:hypothetical protein
MIWLSAAAARRAARLVKFPVAVNVQRAPRRPSKRVEPTRHECTSSRTAATSARRGARRGDTSLMAFGMVSRLVSGWICDRIGGLRTLLLGSFLQGVALVLFLPFDGLVSLYIVSAMFGLFQGGIVPAYAIIMRECTSRGAKPACAPASSSWPRSSAWRWGAGCPGDLRHDWLLPRRLHQRHRLERPEPHHRILAADARTAAAVRKTRSY